MAIVAHPSPNYSDRRTTAKPDLIVLHYTAMNSTAAALDRLCDPACEVSAHYLISESGQTFQLVVEEKRAWHAGAGTWGSCTDVNSASIGIEIANDGTSPFTAAQMDELETLLCTVMARWKIPPERVIAHSDMAPARKCDPGGRFDWRRLALCGCSVWPETGPLIDVDEHEFSLLSQAFGYSEAEAFQTIHAAFRLRFRPWATGALDSTDMGMIADLANRFPVDQTHLTA